MMKNIFLIGMPSSGKSTLGRQLALLLGYEFVDLDQQITEDQQTDIPTLFSTRGEPFFREVERRVLHALPPDSGLLVATGGGTPCFFDNIAFIKRSGISIFLDVPVDELARRIRQHNQDDRPLLSGVSSLETELEQKLKHRISFYSKADLRVTSETHPEAIRALLASLPETPDPV